MLKQKKTKINILVHDYAGHPFPVQLSRTLAARGHRVTHAFCAAVQAPRGKLDNGTDDPGGFDVLALMEGEKIGKYSYLNRWIKERQYGDLLADTIRSIGPDVVLSGNTPTYPQADALKAAHTAGAGFVFWVQDFYGLAVYRLLKKKYPIAGHAAGLLYMRKERKLMEDSDAVVLISDGFRSHMDGWDLEDSRVHVLPNWAPLEDMPQRAKENPWTGEKGLDDRFRFLYCGTLGLKHNPELLLRLARRLRGDTSTAVTVVSEGSGADWLGDRALQEGLDNLSVLGFQPFECLPEVLAAGDVLVAILEPDAGQFSVPSKVLSYLCAGRPLLLSVPGDNPAARIVRENEAGICAEPDDADAFLQGAAELRENGELRSRLGRNGRRYAEKHFDINAVADAFENVLRTAMA